MSDSLFTRSFAAGPRVRLRLGRPADAAAAARCLDGWDELEWRRRLRHNPADRTVLAAFALVEGTDRLVGVAGIDHAPGAEVDLIAVDGSITEGLGELLISALTDRVRRRVA